VKNVMKKVVPWKKGGKRAMKLAQKAKEKEAKLKQQNQALKQKLKKAKRPRIVKVVKRGGKRAMKLAQNVKEHATKAIAKMQKRMSMYKHGSRKYKAAMLKAVTVAKDLQGKLKNAKRPRIVKKVVKKGVERAMKYGKNERDKAAKLAKQLSLKRRQKQMSPHMINTEAKTPKQKVAHKPKKQVAHTPKGKASSKVAFILELPVTKAYFESHKMKLGAKIVQALGIPSNNIVSMKSMQKETAATVVAIILELPMSKADIKSHKTMLQTTMAKALGISPNKIVAIKSKSTEATTSSIEAFIFKLPMTKAYFESHKMKLGAQMAHALKIPPNKILSINSFHQEKANTSTVSFILELPMTKAYIKSHKSMLQVKMAKALKIPRSMIVAIKNPSAPSSITSVVSFRMQLPMTKSYFESHKTEVQAKVAQTLGIPASEISTNVPESGGKQNVAKVKKKAQEQKPTMDSIFAELGDNSAGVQVQFTVTEKAKGATLAEAESVAKSNENNIKNTLTQLDQGKGTISNFKVQETTHSGTGPTAKVFVTALLWIFLFGMSQNYLFGHN